MLACAQRCTRSLRPAENTKKAKGEKKNVVKKQIRHEQYIEARFKRQTDYGQHLNKVSLSPFDSKRWIENKWGGHAGTWNADLAGCRGVD